MLRCGCVPHCITRLWPTRCHVVNPAPVYRPVSKSVKGNKGGEKCALPFLPQPPICSAADDEEAVSEEPPIFSPEVTRHRVLINTH